MRQNGGSVILTAAMAAGVWMAASWPIAHAAEPRTSPHIVAVTPAAAQPAATDLSAQRRARHRPPTRIRVHPRQRPDDVYPRSNPGPNAVRDCNATYVQEFRPSGTVIVPRMTCVWRHG